MSLAKRLDPRAKLALMLWGAVILIAARGWEMPVVVMVSLLLLLGGLGLGSKWLRTVGTLIWMVAVVFLVSWPSFGWLEAALLALRLVALVSLFFVFSQITEPEDLGGALAAMGIPHAFSFALAGSMRFVPVLARKLADIRDAQRARGIDLKLGLWSWPHYFALLAPLVVQSFLLADQLAEAMETRGFSCQGRTSYYEYKMRWFDYLLAGVALLGIGGIVVWHLLSGSGGSQ